MVYQAWPQKGMFMREIKAEDLLTANDDDISISRKARNIFVWGRECNMAYICFYYEIMWVMAKSSVEMWGKPIGKMHAKAIHYLPNATDSQQTHNIIAHIRMMRRPPQPYPPHKSI